MARSISCTELKFMARLPLSQYRIWEFRFQALKIGKVAVDIFHGDALKDAMLLEKPVQLVPGSKAQQPPQFRLGNVTASVFLQRQSFQGAARQVATCPAEAAGQLVGYLKGYLHLRSPKDPLSSVEDMQSLVTN